MTKTPHPLLPRLNEFASYKGGDTFVQNGYIFEYAPTHPLVNVWGWVAQHRLIGEDLVGRPLLRQGSRSKYEVVHHKDENRLNNDPSNLEVMTVSDHMAHHVRERSKKRWGAITPEVVRQALEGRTIKEAAEFLGADHQTIRNHFPDVIACRKRRSPADLSDPKWPGLIRPYAQNEKKGILQCSRELNIGTAAIRKICVKHGIEWISTMPKTPNPTGRPKGSKNIDYRPHILQNHHALDDIREFAKDPTITQVGAAFRLGIRVSLLRAILKHHKIFWRTTMNRFYPSWPRRRKPNRHPLAGNASETEPEWPASDHPQTKPLPERQDLDAAE